MFKAQAITWVLLCLIAGPFVYERLFRWICPRPAYPQQDNGLNAAISTAFYGVLLFLSPFLR